jgi:hypothetical protein
MQVDGQLKCAQLEQLADSAPSPAALGRIYLDTTGGTKAIAKVMDLNRYSKFLTDNRAQAVKTALYTLTLDDEVIFASAAAGGFALTLPAAATAFGKEYVICRTDTVIANDITVTPASGAETIDGSTTFILKTKNDTIRLVSDGSIWKLIAHTYDEGWNAFTPGTANWVTNTTVTAKYRRKGKCIDAEWNHALTGAPDAATLLLCLPSGFQVDTTAMAQSTAGKQLLPGNILIYDTSATERYHGWASLNDADSFTAYKDDGDGTISVVNATAPVTFATGDSVCSRISDIPIVKLR